MENPFGYILNLRQRVIGGILSWLLIMIIGMVIGRGCHHCPICPPAPALVARSHVERDSIVLHDTVWATKSAPSIAVTKRPVAPVAIDKTDGPMHSDSVVSYEVIDTMPDRAVIGFAIASRELPDRYLADLTHTAWYVAAPDRIRIISDTLTVQLPPLPCPSRWQRGVVIGGVCFGVGMAATLTYIALR